ncbi:unnamed protein product [Sphagnum balticum]
MDEYEVKYEEQLDVNTQHKLGTGAFSVVYNGRLHDIPSIRQVVIRRVTLGNVDNGRFAVQLARTVSSRRSFAERATDGQTNTC